MKREAKKRDKKTQTYLNKQDAEKYILKAMNYLSDPDKKKRQTEKLECRHCYYLHDFRIGGAAITEQDCAECGETMSFGSTNTGYCCKDCAKSFGTCSYCGAKLD